MRRQWVRWIMPLLVVPLVAALAACGGDGDGGSDNNPEAVKVVTPEPPTPLTMTFDEKSFLEVASEGDEQAVAASVNLVLGATQLFAVIRDGDERVGEAAVKASGIEFDIGNQEVDWDEDRLVSGFTAPGAWKLNADMPGPGEITFYVQFEDEGGAITRSFGSTRTDRIRVFSERSEISFLGLDLLEIDEASWEISDIRASGDVVTVNGSGDVDLEFAIPGVDDPEFEFRVDNLALDFTDPDAFRRPERGAIHLKLADAMPLLGEDYDIDIEFDDGDAYVTVDGVICDLEFEWNLAAGLPEDLELRDCF